MAEQKSEEEMLKWFEEDLLPRLILENRFPLSGVEPSNLSISALKWEVTANRNTDHFASSPYFLCLSVCETKEKNNVKDFPLIVKFIPQSLVLREAMDIDLQFYNEMVLYTQVLPTFQRFLKDRPNVPTNYFNELCPHCYFADMELDKPDYGIVILEDLRQIGYNTAESKVELDYKHCEIALKQLGKFHAVSYAMKLENSKEFETLKSSFKECRYYDNRYKEESMGIFHEMSGLRGIDYLSAQNECQVPSDYLQYLRNVFTSGIYKKLQKLVSPEEPLSVLVHGDFCRNNILFRLEDGTPNGCVLFDFATFRYCSPAVDLSFFFYLNTMQPFREKYFEELFQAYYNSVIDNVATILNKSKDSVKEIYPLRMFYQDFSSHSVYGYAIIAFFLPMMLFPEENRDLEEEFATKSFHEMAEINVKQGGEIATAKIADVIIDMYKRKIQADQMNVKTWWSGEHMFIIVFIVSWLQRFALSISNLFFGFHWVENWTFQG